MKAIRKTGQAGIDIIKAWETFRSKPYLCPSGIPTVGYGHTRTASINMTPISEHTAEVLLKVDLEIVEAQVNRLVKYLDIDQNNFDAIVCLVFNIGIGNFEKSNTFRLIKENPKKLEIADEWIGFRKSNNKPLRGLLLRRLDEIKLYFS